MYRSGVTVHRSFADASSPALLKACGTPIGAVTRLPLVASRSSRPLVNRTVPVKMKKLSSCSWWMCCGGPPHPGASVHSTRPQRPSTPLPSERTRKSAPPALQLSPAPAGLTEMVMSSLRVPRFLAQSGTDRDVAGRGSRTVHEPGGRGRLGELSLGCGEWLVRLAFAASGHRRAHCGFA